jgi:hypothetical protein
MLVQLSFYKHNDFLNKIDIKPNDIRKFAKSLLKQIDYEKVSSFLFSGYYGRWMY